MKQTAVELLGLIDHSIINYYAKNIEEPFGILMNKNNLIILKEYFKNTIGIVPESYNDFKYRGIKIMISYDLNDNEIKIVI